MRGVAGGTNELRTNLKTSEANQNSKRKPIPAHTQHIDTHTHTQYTHIDWRATRCSLLRLAHARINCKYIEIFTHLRASERATECACVRYKNLLRYTYSTHTHIYRGAHTRDGMRGCLSHAISLARLGAFSHSPPRRILRRYTKIQDTKRRPPLAERG